MFTTLNQILTKPEENGRYLLNVGINFVMSKWVLKWFRQCFGSCWSPYCTINICFSAKMKGSGSGIVWTLWFIIYMHLFSFLLYSSDEIRLGRIIRAIRIHSVRRRFIVWALGSRLSQNPLGILPNAISRAPTLWNYYYGKFLYFFSS